MNTPSAARPPGAPRRSGHEIKRRGFRLRCVCLWAAVALAGSVAQAATVVSTWTSAISGIWNSDSNWTNVPAQGGFPNNGNGGVATYDAVVNATGAAYSVNLGTDITVEDLLLSSASATINHTAGTLTATGAIDVSAGTYSLNGGTIRDTTINVSGSGAFSVGANSNNMLSGVTVNGDLILNTENARTQIGPGTSFTTAHLAAKSAELGFAPGSIVNGNILFEDTKTAGTRYLSMNGTAGTVTIAPGSILRWQPGPVGAPPYGEAIIGPGDVFSGEMTLMNQGTISSEAYQQKITVSPANFTNMGGPNPGTLSASNHGILTISATNWSNAGNINVNSASINLSGTFNNTGNINVTGGSANFSGTWSNAAGTMTVDASSTLNLGGNFTTAGLGTLAIAPGGSLSRISVTGVWDNSGQSFTFKDASNSWTLSGGTISGGTLNFPNGDGLRISGYSNLLTGVAINGDLQLYSSGLGVKIEGGTTFRTASLFAGSELGFEPGSTLTGTIFADGHSLLGPCYVTMNGNAGTFTVGPTGVIRCGYASIGSGNRYGGAMTLVNQGLITTSTLGGAGPKGLTIAGASFTNSGTLEANGYLGVASASFTNSGTLQVTQFGYLSRPFGYTQTAGVTRVMGGTIIDTTASGVIQINGGTLEGYGSIRANVSASGIIDPKLGSTSAPALAITGDLSLGTDAELRFSLGGTTKGTQYDFLSEAGTVPLKLDGTLEVDFANGFQSTVTGANTFTILTSNQNLTGHFVNVKSGTRLNTADGFGSFIVTYSGQSVVLSNYLVPEPGLAGLFAAAGILLLSRRSKAARGQLI